MKSKSSSIVIKLFILFFIFAALYFGKSILVPFAIAAVLATVFLPFCRWMERRRMPKAFAAFTSIVILLLLIAAIGMVLSWQVSALANDITLIKQKAISIVDQLQDFLLTRIGISVDTQWHLIKEQQIAFSEMLPSLAGSFVYLLIDILFTLAYVFFLLYYRSHIKKFILQLVLPEQRVETQVVLNNITWVSSQYLLGLGKMIVCLWVMYSIGFGLMGVENALFFAILCGLLEIVPFIGNLTGTAITLLSCTVHGAELPMLIGVAATYGVVQFVQGWLLEPLIVGPQVKINPLFTIIALVLGELVWGIPGVVLAIPITAMVKIVCDHVDGLKPYGFLMGDVDSKKVELLKTE